MKKLGWADKPKEDGKYITLRKTDGMVGFSNVWSKFELPPSIVMEYWWLGPLPEPPMND